MHTELNEIDYELELDKIISAIKKQNAKRVLIQLPEGLKQYGPSIIKELEKMLGDKSKVKIFIWMGSCFGACDVPLEAESLGIDLIVQFGHSAWKFEKEQKKIKVVK